MRKFFGVFFIVLGILSFSFAVNWLGYIFVGISLIAFGIYIIPSRKITGWQGGFSGSDSDVRTHIGNGSDFAYDRNVFVRDSNGDLREY